MEEKTYTLAQIHAAFIAEFNESGELWFPYRSKWNRCIAEECLEVTEAAFEDFLEELEKAVTNGTT